MGNLCMGCVRHGSIPYCGFCSPPYYRNCLLHASILTNASKQKPGIAAHAGRLPLVFAMALAPSTRLIARFDDRELRPLATPVKHVERFGLVLLSQNRL